MSCFHPLYRTSEIWCHHPHSLMFMGGKDGRWSTSPDPPLLDLFELVAFPWKVSAIYSYPSYTHKLIMFSVTWN